MSLIHSFSLLMLMFLLLVDSFLKQSSILNFKSKHNSRLQDVIAGDIVTNDLSLQLKLITFNILAPCYSKSNESYIDRNHQICNRLLESKADIICLQEYWINNEELKKLYQNRLGGIYDMRELRRTSYWREREDGLAMFYNKDKFILQDVKVINTLMYHIFIFF